MLNLTAPRLNSGRSSFVAPARHKRLSPAEPSPELTAYRFAPAPHRTTAPLLHSIGRPLRSLRSIGRPLRSCAPSDDRFAPALHRTTASLPALHRTAAPLPALHRTTAPLPVLLRSCAPSDDRFAPCNPSDDRFAPALHRATASLLHSVYGTPAPSTDLRGIEG